PRANASLDRAREEIGTIEEIANALADNLPAPKLTARKSRRRRRKRKSAQVAENGRATAATESRPSDKAPDGAGDAGDAVPLVTASEQTDDARELDATAEDAA